MKYNRIGATDVLVTELGLGTAQLGDLYDRLDQDRSTEIVDAAWTAGVRYFDTAPHYGLGLAESRLGAALRGCNRSEYVVSTKVGRLVERTEDGAACRWDFSASGIDRSIEESLGRLGLDRVDIALIHDPQGRMPEALDSAYPALSRLRTQGVIGAIGVGSGDLGALQAFADDTDIDVVMVAGRYTLLEQPAAESLLPACSARGISVLNAGVFNTGLLAGAAPDESRRYEYAPVPTALLDRAKRLARFAQAHRTTLPQAALKFAAHDPTVASVVVGADSADQITANAARLLEKLPLDSLWAELESVGLLRQGKD